MNLLLENNFGVPSQNFAIKDVLCEKGDEITRFDGTLYSSVETDLHHQGYFCSIP